MSGLFISVGSFDRFARGYRAQAFAFISVSWKFSLCCHVVNLETTALVVLSKDSLGILVELWSCREAAVMCESVFLWADRKLKRRHSVVRNTQRGLSW